MTRKKVNDPEDLLSRNLIIRVTENTYNQLEELRKDSKNLSIAAVARKILSGQKINLYHHDVSLNPVMEELALIRKELKAIGVNINQITRSFNQDRTGTSRAYWNCNSILEVFLLSDYFF
ncbi:plasmid mobilization relaxosome protein MobC [Pedobacter petrophilus]|uniref:Plasmid mobilization relaxosome protein MobC n=1 Tax=Pedobacter petrophilus TaxID=1908241 RepID=A0A7K0G1R0_9SPHI|nr:plasmid mobilization relaxosome protein MobC [Pedobacter petrophilus]MRX77773.1 plasmid mobilization relaxosome protein MobC [Pedobacter petrophilus]